MVYHGKPSKACLPCRKRKLICDLDAKGCSQCRRAKIGCTGYRDTEALRVKDETEMVAKRAWDRQRQHTPPIHSLDLDLCCQAKDIFYHNHVIGPNKSYDFLQPYYSMSASEQHLVTSIDAVSLASLNYQKNSQRAQQKAQKKYVQALQLTQKALIEPNIATEDSALLSVLLLDLYEKINNKDSPIRGSWDAHLEGALSLVKIRGYDQFETPAGFRILTRLMTNFLISCVATDREVPAELIKLWHMVASKSLEASHPKRREFELMLTYASLNYRVKHGLVGKDEILETAIKLEAQFKALAEELFKLCPYHIISVIEKSSHHFKPYHHKYSVEQVTQLWNVFRLTRILLNDLICKYGGSQDTIPPPFDMNDAKKNIQYLGSEICATVPQYICNSDEPLPSNGVTQRAHPDHSLIAKAAPATHYQPCYRLIFPLYVAGQSPWSSGELKRYVIQELRFMADFHGIKNAVKVAELLESGDSHDPWQVYMMLGSYAFVC